MNLGDIAVLLGINLAVVAAAMVALWLVAVRVRDVSLIDAAWPIAMLLAAAVSFAGTDGDPIRKRLLLWLTAVWAIRLGWHLFRRWREHGKDHRYDFVEALVKKNGWAFSRVALILVFLPQAFLAWLVSLPVQLGQVAYEPSIGWLGWTGAVVVVVGIAFESIGDTQLAHFKADPANKGKVLDTGLWKYTRHPNYFGDACVWWGLYLIAAETGPGVWAILGPIFLTWTLTRWSGIGLSEASSRKRRPDYAAYVARTSAFIPWPPRRTGD